MKPRFCFILACLCYVVSFSQAQTSAKRIALVIGAQHYTSLPPLHNSLNDAKSMAATLKAKGFLVDAVYDPKSKKEIKDAINRYYRNMRDHFGAVGLIFYAGHGIQFEGDNYIIPTQSTLRNPGDLEDQCIKLNSVMAILKTTSQTLNILILDACRSVPSFTRGDIDQGLAKMNAPEGTMIMFAAQPGKKALDGSGMNGLFTSKLLKFINEPDLHIREVFSRVKQEVYYASNKSQLPSIEDNSIGGDFYFTPSKSVIFASANNTLVNQSVKSETTKPFTRYEVSRTYSESDFGYGANHYGAVNIGNQQWNTQNLNVDHFSNGETIFQAKTNEEWIRANDSRLPAWCYYNNDRSNGMTFGKLYNYYAVSDPQGLCPAGWHVSSDGEWTNLAKSLGSKAGAHLKYFTSWKENGNGTNDAEFAGLPGGFRNGLGEFQFKGTAGIWWSGTEYNSGNSWYHILGYNSDVVYRSHESKSNGYSVRCLMD